MYLTIQGLVLRVTTYNETDALLTVLTHSHGKLTIKARGLRRKNSPLVAPCQLLAYGEFTLFEHRGLYTINEAKSLEIFRELRNDLQKLTLGTYFAQVAEVLCQEDMPNPELLSLTLNCLFALSKLDKNELLIKSVFELRSACLAGYAPDLDACYHCGATAPNLLNLSEGRLECTTCNPATDVDIRMPINITMLDAMRYICRCQPKKLFSFSLELDVLERLSTTTESYLATQLERGFSTLDFYKSLLINPV